MRTHCSRHANCYYYDNSIDNDEGVNYLKMHIFKQVALLLQRDRARHL